MTVTKIKNSPDLERKSEESTGIVKADKSVVKVPEYDIDTFLATRKEFIDKVNAIFVEKQDYHVINSKKSMAKGGAEKIASIFHWQAKFTRDDEALEMLGSTPGLVAFVCRLSKGARYVGEGRGASTLQKNAGDPNKTLKMAQKSAFIDAVLRASGLSDFFTQDLEDIPAEHLSILQPEAPRTQNLKPQQVMSKEFFCSEHGETVRLLPAGKTKQGKTYPAFYACSERPNGEFCKAPIVNADHDEVRRGPGGVMEVVGKKVEEIPTITYDDEPFSSGTKLHEVEILKEDMPP